MPDAFELWERLGARDAAAVTAAALDWLLRGFVERLESFSERPRRLLIRARSCGFQL